MAFLALVLAAVLWSTSFPVIKWGLGFLSPLPFAFLRFLVAALLFLPYLLRIPGERLKRALQRKGLLSLAFLNALGYVFQFLGQQYTDAGRTALFINTYVLWVPVLSVLWLRAPVGRRTWGALALALVGLILITTGGHLGRIFAQVRWKGDALALAASFTWGFYIVIAKRELATVPPLLLSALVVWGSLPFLLPFFLLSPQVPTGWAGWGAVLYLAVFCTVLPYFLYAYGLRETSPVFSSLVLLLEVVAAAGLSAFFLGERFSGSDLLGALLILVGILLAEPG